VSFLFCFSATVSGKPASARASTKPVKIANHSMYCLRHFLPMYFPSFSRGRLTRGRLFLSSSASPYFVLLLAISFAFAHRPWYPFQHPSETLRERKINW
jgi:hypothetical protein